jgi:hypothetical protein
MDRIDFHILVEGMQQGMMIQELPDFSKITDYLKSLGPTEQERISKAVSVMIANSFDPPFSQFLEKTFKKDYHGKIDFVELVNRTIRGDKEAIGIMFEKIGMPLLDFYEKKISASIFKSSVSGDRTIDRIYSRFIQGIFDDKNFINAFEKRVEKLIIGRVKDVGNSTEFADATEPDRQEVSEGNILTEGIFDIAKGFKGKEAKAKYQILDKLLGYVPNVNSKLKKTIKIGIFNSSYRDLVKLQSRMNSSKVANILGEVILTYMKEQSIKSFKGNNDPFIREFMKMLEDIISKQSLQRKFENGLAEYFAQMELKRNVK